MSLPARKKLLVLFCCTFYLSANAADERYIFDIPTLKVEEALGKLAVQTGRQLLFSYELVDSLDSSNVSGEYTVESALDVLLQGTGLSGSLTERGVILITPMDAQNKAQKGREKMKKNKLSIGIFAAIASVFGGGLSVEAQEQDSSSSNATQLEEIVVTGFRYSLLKSLEKKRDSVGVIESITAEDIGKFPDLNIAESLQRLPGVTLSRSALGEGSSINLRGLGPQFTRVEINGMTATSGNTGSRGFSFEILPSELFSNVDIYKTPDASRAEGGVSGTVSLQTPRPFDYDETQFVVSAQGSWAEASGDVDPRISGLFATQLTDTFGVSLALSHSDARYQVNEVSFSEWQEFNEITTAANRDPNDPNNLTNEPYFGSLLPKTSLFRVFDQQRETNSAVATFQLRPSKDLDVVLNVMKAEISGTEIENRPDLPLEFNVPAPDAFTLAERRGNSAIDTATFSGNQVRIGTRFEPKQQDLSNVTLSVDWQATDSLKVSPFVGYTKREGLDESSLYSFRINNADISYTSAGGVPSISTSVTDFQSNPEDFGMNIFIFSRNADVDEEVNAKLDFDWEINETGLTNVQFGTRYSAREAERDNDFSLLFRNSAIFGGQTAPALDSAFFLQNFSVGGSSAGIPNRILSADPAAVASIFYNNLDPFTATAADGFAPTSEANERIREYIIEEDTLALYAQANFVWDNISLVAGVRYVDTDQTSDGVQVSNGIITPVDFQNEYSAVLPVVTMKIDVTDDIVLRSSYAETLTRPNISDLRPSQSINPGFRSGSGGNPTLQPFTSEQIDLGAEWYFQDEAVLGITYFNRQLSSVVVNDTNTILATFPDQVTQQPITEFINFSQPVNAEGFTASGVELFVQSPLNFLPEPFDNLGVLANYTLINPPGVTVSDTGDVTSPFVSVSEDAYNFALYYDDGRFEGRLAYSYRSDFAGSSEVTRFRDDSFGQWDLSASFNINDKLQVLMQALNITDEQITTTSQGQPSTVRELERRVTAGVRYKF